MNNTVYKLWVDDQIDSVRPIPLGYNWFGVMSSVEAIKMIGEYGIPAFISFDYDLGGDDTVEPFIKYMIENHYDEEVPEYEIHSENIAGQKIIESLMESWKKSKSL